MMIMINRILNHDPSIFTGKSLDNDGEAPVICTEDYVVFRVKADAKTVLLDGWLYMFFNRDEFDRYVITNSWGSSTEFYNWEDICDVKIDLPSLPIQQKYVAIYKAMVANQQSYERGLEDLRITFESYMDELRKQQDEEKIGAYIELVERTNSDLQYGIGILSLRTF